MKPKTYSTNSLQDIANAVTPENLDDFVKDFKGVLRSYLYLVSFAKCKMESEPEGIKNTDLVEFHGLYWTDDGKHDITCEIVEKDA